MSLWVSILRVSWFFFIFLFLFFFSFFFVRRGGGGGQDRQNADIREDKRRGSIYVSCSSLFQLTLRPAALSVGVV